MKKLFILLLMLVVCGNAQAASWDVDNPDTSTKYVNEGFDAILDNQNALDRVLAGYRQNCKITYNSTTSFDVGAGEIVLSNTAGDVRVFARNTSTTTTTPTISASTTYYVYAYVDSTSTEAFSIEVNTSATTPSGTYYRRLGSFYSDASSYIININNDDAVSARAYDSGWFSLSANNTSTKTHNLGTTNIIPTLFFSSSSDGSTYFYGGGCLTSWINNDQGAINNGIAFDELTTTTIRVRFGDQIDVPDGTSQSTKTSGYVRIIILAID